MNDLLNKVTSAINVLKAFEPDDGYYLRLCRNQLTFVISPKTPRLVVARLNKTTTNPRG